MLHCQISYENEELIATNDLTSFHSPPSDRSFNSQSSMADAPLVVCDAMCARGPHSALFVLCASTFDLDYNSRLVGHSNDACVLL